jgi:hypothetical protein
VVFGVCGFAVVMLGVVILFFLALMRTLDLVRPRNRAMEPGQVWLNLVPCLNIVWQFLTVVWVAKSLDAEFRDRGLHRQGEDYGRTVGLAGLIANVASGVLGQVVQTIAEVNGDVNLAFVGAGVAVFGSVVSLVLFGMYWVKIAGFRKELQETRGRWDDGRDDRDREYRRPDPDDRDDDDDPDRGYRRRYD